MDVLDSATSGSTLHLVPIDNPPTTDGHPGRIVRRLLEERGWSQDELAAITGYSRQAISGVVAGKSSVTAEMAVSLAAAFGNDAAEWLRLDAEYQLSLVDGDSTLVERRAALYREAPIRDMQKRGWIKDTSDLDELEAELTAFFGGSIIDGVAFPVAPRRTVALDHLNAAERAWCFRARQLASVVPVHAFDPARVGRLEQKLRLLAAYPAEIRRLPRVLAEFGIRLVVVEPLPGARIDGASFRVGDHPVIAVSVRWDRIDAFWFTVFHEFFHIKHGDIYSADANLVTEAIKGVVSVTIPDDDTERRANQEASETLVPQAELESFVRRLSPLYSSDRIVQFAHKVKMHPGIIVGQLQHRQELGYSAHRDFLVKVRGLITETALTDGYGHSVGLGVV